MMKWAIKIGVKLVLARLPISYGIWRYLGMFRHGQMDSADYSFKIFGLHATRAYAQGLPPNAVILELGPGDSIASAIIGNAFGAGLIYLIDVGNFANHNIDFYRGLSKHLNERGLLTKDLSGAGSIDDVLKDCNAHYFSRGIESLKKVPSGSIDYVWSHSVLEHVRKAEFPLLLQELLRVMKPGALASHNIDFQDHLDSSLNNLRFSERLWESSFFSSSGFYTNRIPATMMHDMFRNAGFIVEQEEYGQWPNLPIPRASLHKEFQKFSDSDLINRTSHVLLRKSIRQAINK